MVPIVLAIWGMIGWKVYAAMKGKDNQISIVTNVEKIKSGGTEISDTIQLIANYRDPFLDKQIAIKDNSKFRILNSKLPVVKVAEPPQAPIVWPTIIYHGLIKKSGNEKTIGFLSVDGQSHFVQSGQQAGVVRVLRIWKDSVEVFWEDKKKVLRK